MNTLQRRFTTICLTLGLALFTPGLARAQYIVTDLGSLVPGGHSKGYGINSDGQVTGQTDVPGNMHAFLWSPTEPNAPAGEMGDLGAVAHPDFGTYANWSVGAAISSTGPVGFGSGGAFSTPTMLAMHFTGGAPEILPMLPHPDTILPNSQALATNDSGAIVGTAQNALGIYHAVKWDPGITDFNVFAGSDFVLKEAWGINSFGQVAGVGVKAGINHAFLCTPSSGGVTDLGILINALVGTDTHSFGRGINDDGKVVGYFLVPPGSDLPARYHAFLYDPSAADGIYMKDLGVPPSPLPPPFRPYINSIAVRINSEGKIVGWANTYPGLAMHDHPFTPLFPPPGCPPTLCPPTHYYIFSHAFVWDPALATGGDPSAGWIDLNGLVPTSSGLTAAYDINSYGQIVAWASEDPPLPPLSKAFLLTPAP